MLNTCQAFFEDKLVLYVLIVSFEAMYRNVIIEALKGRIIALKKGFHRKNHILHAS
jgi:hypothetical protein